VIRILLLLLGALPGLAQPSSPLLAAAAADLAPLEPKLADLYHKTYGARLRFVLGSSGLLAAQIRQGAPYDAYLSANDQYVRDLAETGHLDPASITTYATGRLGLFAIQTQFRSLEALASPRIRHIAIANPAHAPYGVAAREALERLGLWDRLKPRLVYGENVRQTLQLAESGNAEVALVAWSLVLNKGGVLIPDAWHQPIRQAGGVVARSARKPDARRLFELLASPAGRDLLREFGFGP
jgi:molybdate transport system substrate-binding protein